MTISIIGSGNMAYQIGRAFAEAGHTIDTVYARNEKEGSQLARSIHAKYESDIQQCADRVDVVVVAISDDAIQEILNHLTLERSILVHTSGTHSMEVLKNTAMRYGSFYPLQTMTKEAQLDMKAVPVLIDASEKEVKEQLMQLAQSISDKACFVKDQDRASIHLAAVCVNNFVNHLLVLAEEYLKDQSLSFELLRPLIRETLEKSLSFSPGESQTGPAKRGDVNIIARHLGMLEAHPELKQFYQLFSDHIQKRYTTP